MVWAGFILGLFGSLHCLGMCGPIALALPIQTTSKTMRLLAACVYNIGRVITYSILGLLLGIVGSAFQFVGMQQVLSITAGILLILLILFPFLFKKFSAGKALFEMPYVQALKVSISTRLKTHTFSSLFGIGLLNGLLPCGLVSVAIIGAIAMDTMLQSGIYMALFGLGTLPAMVVLVFTKNYIPMHVKHAFQKAVPIFVCALGILLILRGMNLDIPYVSPAVNGACCAEASCH